VDVLLPWQLSTIQQPVISLHSAWWWISFLFKYIHIWKKKTNKLSTGSSLETIPMATLDGGSHRSYIDSCISNYHRMKAVTVLNIDILNYHT
jgi:hypothetical protein